MVEYLVVDAAFSVPARTKEFNRYAAEGWRLVTVADGRAYFERPKEEAPSEEAGASAS